MPEQLYICPCCGGDGKETCTNPDHGFIDFIGGETGRLGCPVCGHHPEHKVRSGGLCDTCEGSGKVTVAQFNFFCLDTGYDNEPVAL